MAEISNLANYSNAQLLAQVLKNCGKIPTSVNEISSEILKHFSFSLHDRNFLSFLAYFPLKHYFEGESVKLTSDIFDQLEQTSDEYYVYKEYPYLVYKIPYGEDNSHQEFMELTKGPHHEDIIQKDPFFDGIPTYEIAAKMFLPRAETTELVEDEIDNEAEGHQKIITREDFLIFKDGNPYRWHLSNLIWNSVANETFPVASAKKLAIGKYGKFDFGNKYFWDIEKGEIFYIKNDKKVYPSISQSGNYQIITLKDVKNKYHSLSYDKLFIHMCYKTDEYKKKINEINSVIV